jgi:hypothetical protein
LRGLGTLGIGTLTTGGKAAGRLAWHAKDPAAYLRVIVSVLPKDIKIDRRLDAGPLSDLNEDELEALLYAARNAVAQADAAAEQGSSENSS